MANVVHPRLDVLRNRAGYFIRTGEAMDGRLES